MPNQKVRGNLSVTGNLTVSGTITPTLGTEYADNAFALKDNSDATKKLAFQLSGFTTGNTRTLTPPDYDGTLATLAGTETFTNKTLTSPKIGTAINDTGGKELFKLTATASAVNEFTVANAAAGGSPTVSATGDDTNISIKFVPKGTGKFLPKSAPIHYGAAPAQITTASNVAFTAAQLLSGFVDRDPNGGDRADTVPSAADLVAAIPGAEIGHWFEFVLKNSTDAGSGETITVTAPSVAVTVVGTAAVARLNSKRFRVELTNVTAESEAYTITSLGTFVH